MTKMIEDIKFSDSYSKKELLEAIECLQHNYKQLENTYNRAVYVNKKMAVILDSCKIKIDWIKLEVIKNKQIDIKELIPFMKKEGYLYADRKSWFYTKYKPVLRKDIFGKYAWFINSYDVNLSDIFNIAPSKDWTKSLIKVGGK